MEMKSIHILYQENICCIHKTFCTKPENCEMINKIKRNDQNKIKMTMKE